MSTSVCVCVCEDISGITRAIFTKFLVHVAYGSGSVVFRRYEIPREMDNFEEKRVPDKPNTPTNCEFDWSMQRYTTGADA